MQLMRVTGAWHRRVRMTLSRGAVIVLYHRVATLKSDPLLLSVTPDNFRQQIEALKSRGPVLSLRELTSYLMTRRTIPRNSAVVTFDDGYADNLMIAQEILGELGARATFFVATGSVGSSEGMWWDELERLLFARLDQPETLRVDVGGHSFNWNLEPSDDNLGREWSILSRFDPTPRHSAFRALFHELKVLPVKDRTQVLQDMATQLRHRAPGHQDCRLLTTHEIEQLARQDEVEVGAHTVAHPTLAALRERAEAAEIEQSKRALEEIAGVSVDFFAYPYGSKADYTARTVAHVRKAGFMAACSNFEQPLLRGTDRYQLPRFLARDWDGDLFLERLGAAFL